MKLSIFPKAKALPSTKEEKASEARFVSKPYYPELREFRTEEDLIEIMCNFAYSPITYNGFRREANFEGTDLIVFDIDEGQTIEEAEQVVHKLDIACLCLPSTSHTDAHHKFRLVFPLSRTITKVATYKATYAKLAENFNVDPACKDAARFFFGSRMIAGFWYDADLLDPVAPQKVKKQLKMDFSTKANVVVGESTEELVEALYGEKRDKIPEPIAYFLENAPDNLSGEWFYRSNSFLFTCGLLELEQNVVSEVFFSLYPHDELTEKVVDRMINDGYNAREVPDFSSRDDIIRELEEEL